MADEDDLDAFFDEVDEVVEEVKKEEKEEIIVPSSTLSKEGDEDVDRPSKRIRISDEDTAPVIKKAAVVISKAATTISAPPVHHSNNNNTDGNGNGIYQITVPESCLQQQAPPPPPPPPSQQQFAATYQMHNQSNKPVVRVAAGKKWVDNTLSDFPENDFRLFVGNLDAVVTEQKLAESFQSKYPSFAMCRIIYDKNSGESKGYGFVSVMDPKDCAKAIREMDGSWLASRPIKVKRSDWKERDLKHVRKAKKGRRR